MLNLAFSKFLTLSPMKLIFGTLIIQTFFDWSTNIVFSNKQMVGDTVFYKQKFLVSIH